MGRSQCCEKVGLKSGRWTAEEDAILTDYIRVHGEGSWKLLPKNAGLLRCGKSCRLRWINYLRSDLKRGKFSKEEDDIIACLHGSFGNRDTRPAHPSSLVVRHTTRQWSLVVPASHLINLISHQKDPNHPKWSQIAAHLSGRTDNEIKNYWNSHLSRKILPSRWSLNPPSITIIPTVNKPKGRTSRANMKINTTYKSSTITNPKVDAPYEQPTKQQTNVDTCATSYEDDMRSFIEIMDQDMLTMAKDGGSMGCVASELTVKGVSERVEIGGLSALTMDSFDVWNWNFDVEDGVLGLGGEENDNILSWSWENTTIDDDNLLGIDAWFMS